ncbi:MAG: 1-deoxy-D-xylulose-5-phosphate reductoisomerase [Deltaproteobacteria bacterium]|nr:1-deoxy-D-xylulose-5-phosphate reductoisomerase [Deltaproteobacteria bacterium]
MLKTLSILGSTGSIGTSTLDVVRQNPNRFRVQALAAGKNLNLLIEQIREFKPKLVSVQHEKDLPPLREIFPELKIFSGTTGPTEIASLAEVDLVVSALVGAAGLLPTLKAIEMGKDIALANKETMVIAGELVNEAAKKAGVKIYPVDSEHSAIFQALQGNRIEEVRKIILTASGGPFRTHALEDLQNVTLAQALKHPNWNMGQKITIDSATLMNKGFEVIEARWLFDLPEEKIEVLIHPQSIIHSMVEYQDGSVMAQLGIPDMRVPISYALSYPERLKNNLVSLDLIKIQNLSFFEPNLNKFKCLALAKRALKLGGGAPCILNAANEVAVDLFLKEEIGFLQIPELNEWVMKAGQEQRASTIEDLIRLDAWSREKAMEYFETIDLFRKSLYDPIAALRYPKNPHLQ